MMQADESANKVEFMTILISMINHGASPERIFKPIYRKYNSRINVSDQVSFETNTINPRIHGLNRVLSETDTINPRIYPWVSEYKKSQTKNRFNGLHMPERT